jgi:hypothetical protein
VEVGGRRAVEGSAGVDVHQQQPFARETQVEAAEIFQGPSEQTCTHQ